MSDFTEIRVIDDSGNMGELQFNALIDLSDIALVTPIRDWNNGFHPDRCRAQFKGHGSFVLVALSYDSLKALLIERRVKDLIMAPEPS